MRSYERFDRAMSRLATAWAEALEAAAEIMEDDGWRLDGSRTFASWITARYPVSARTAGEIVRDAMALAERPVVREALAAGSITTDQAKALAVLCEPDSDEPSHGWSVCRSGPIRNWNAKRGRRRRESWNAATTESSCA